MTITPEKPPMGSDIDNDTIWLQEITAREEEHRHAFVARDLERLTALWSDAFLVNSPMNRVHNKRQVLDLLRAGTIAHSSFDAQIDAIERRGDLVIVMGSERIINAPDSPVVNRRFTNVWRPEDGSWRLIMRHANIAAN